MLRASATSLMSTRQFLSIIFFTFSMLTSLAEVDGRLAWGVFYNLTTLTECFMPLKFHWKHNILIKLVVHFFSMWYDYMTAASFLPFLVRFHDYKINEWKSTCWYAISNKNAVFFMSRLWWKIYSIYRLNLQSCRKSWLFGKKNNLNMVILSQKGMVVPIT